MSGFSGRSLRWSRIASRNTPESSTIAIGCPARAQPIAQARWCGPRRPAMKKHPVSTSSPVTLIARCGAGVGVDACSWPTSPGGLMGFAAAVRLVRPALAAARAYAAGGAAVTTRFAARQATSARRGVAG